MRKSFFIFCFLPYFMGHLFSQTVYHQDVFYGGVTGGGFSTGLGLGAGLLDLFIEPSSTIRKAFLIAYSAGPNTQSSVLLNNIHFQFDSSNIVQINPQISQFYTPTNIHVIDVTEFISLNTMNQYTIETIVHPEMPFRGVFAPYLYVEYDNVNLPPVSTCVIINNQFGNGMSSIVLNNLTPIKNGFNFGFALYTDRHSINTNERSDVYFNSNYLGRVYGADAVNENWGTGVKGHFFYQNNTLFGLDDDVPNNTMNESDALADVASYVTDNATTVDFTLTQVTYPNVLPSQLNIFLAYFLTYTSPCQPFEASLLTSDTTTCVNMPLQLGVSVHDTINATYEWLPQTNLSCYDCPNPEFIGDSSIVYTVRIWSTDSCSKVLPVKVKVLPQPEFSSINLTPSACGEESGTIAGTSSSLNLPLSYSLNGGAAQNNGNFSGLASSTYTLTVTDGNGCSADSTVFIGEEILVNASFTVEPPTGSAPLWVQSTNASTNATNYLWSWANETSTDSHPGFMLDTSGTYTVTLIAYNNFPECADTFSVQVVVYDSLQIIIPNVFTPNNDQSNDFFGITTNVTTSGTVVILNRWGNVMLEHSFSTQPHLFTPLWDGKEATEGVYFYRVRMITEVSGQGAENEEFEYSGFVTLVR
jgi:gliding motility-associated-like protein